MDIPEKLAKWGTQDEDKQNKTKNNTIYVRHHYRQQNTNNVNKTRISPQTTGGNSIRACPIGFAVILAIISLSVIYVIYI